MSSKPWSKKHPCCVECGTTETKHVARGLCPKCYSQHRYATNPAYRALRSRIAKRYSLATSEQRIEKNRIYRAKNTEKIAVKAAQLWATRQSEGFTADLVRGDMVTAEYLTKAYRMGSKYVLDGECVVNLLDENGKVRHEAVPLQSLRRAE